MSFAPYDNPKYAICILVQNGGSGGGVCGPLVNLVYRGLFARDNKGIRLPVKPMTKVLGNTDRIEKSIEISPEMIATVEAGDTEPAPDAIAAATQVAPVEETSGETGEEAGDVAAEIPVVPSTADTPTPTITPEVDAEGSEIPKAIPVKEP